VVVQLHLPGGWWPDRLSNASSTPTETAIPEGTGGARLDWEPEEAHCPILLVARHPEVGCGHPGRTGHAPLSVVGDEVDGELVLAEVLGVGDGAQLGHHLDAPLP